MMQEECWRAEVSGKRPVDEIAALQVGHGGCDLRCHVEEDDSVDLLAVGPSQVVEQIASGHELGDDVKGRLAGAHAQ